MTHADAWDQIPWLLNDTLEGGQRKQLEQHLGECRQCREELEVQRALMQTMNARPLVEAMPRASLQKLWARLDADPVTASAATALPQSRSAFSWRVAAAASVILLLGASLLAMVVGGDRPAAEFRTVSDPAAATGIPGIRAVFAGETTVAELQALLERTGLRIVAGPSASGVYTLGTASAADDAQAALLVLRANPAVRFAEPATH